MPGWPRFRISLIFIYWIVNIYPNTKPAGLAGFFPEGGKNVFFLVFAGKKVFARTYFYYNKILLYCVYFLN